MDTDQPEKTKSAAPRAKPALTREDRLKKALRANLQRRKAQGRARVADKDHDES